MKIIDLSSFVETNDGEPNAIEYQRIDYKNGAKLICENVKMHFGIENEKICPEAFPNGEFITKETIKLETHMGTHIDAPSHFGSLCEGKTPKTIDECPLEWFLGNGVLIEVKKKGGEFITKEDIIIELKKKNYNLQKGDIVLISTGTDKLWGTKEYFSNAPGMSCEAVEYILSFGVKVIGIDTYSFDRPFKNMLNDFIQTGEKSNLWPTHFLGREKEYVHIERLQNLKALTSVERFNVACFPIKLKGMDAAWTRAVAIIEDE